MKKNLYNLFDKKGFENSLTIEGNIEKLPTSLKYLLYLPENDPFVQKCDLNQQWNIDFNKYINTYDISDILRKNNAFLLELFIHQPDYFNQHFIPYIDRIDTKLFNYLIEIWMVPGDKKKSFEYDEYEKTCVMENFIKYNQNLISLKHLTYFKEWHIRKPFEPQFLNDAIENNQLFSPDILTWSEYSRIYFDDSTLAMNEACIKSILPFFFKEQGLYKISKHINEHLAWLEEYMPTVITTYLKHYFIACLSIYRNKKNISVNSEIQNIPDKYTPVVINMLTMYLNQMEDSYFFELENVLPLMMSEPGLNLLNTHILHFRQHNLTVERLNLVPTAEEMHQLNDITLAGLISILNSNTLDYNDGWGLVPTHLIELVQNGIISPSDIASEWKQHIEQTYQYAFEQPELFFGRTQPLSEITLSL